MTEEMRFIKYTAIALVVFGGVGLGMYAVGRPATVAIDNLTFHQSQAYNDGMVRDLGQFQLDYAATHDEGSRDAIRAVVRDRYASYDDSKLPIRLQIFLNQMRGN